MKEYKIRGNIPVTIFNCDDMTQEESAMYLERVEMQFPDRKVKELVLSQTVDDETGELMIDIAYKLEPVRFERIRRITGYLVGTLDNWNDAKTAEEKDRVKHGVDNSGFERL